MYNYINVFYHKIDTYDRIFLRIFTHVHTASFKKSIMKLTLFFELNKWARSDKKNPIFCYIEKKCNNRQSTFLDLLTLSAYIKLS